MTAHDASWSIHLPCGRCGSTSEDLECVPATPTEAENDDQAVMEPLHRQPAYDAVYAVIGANPPRSTDSYGQAAENARVWRAVEAALDAMEAAGLLLPAGTKTVEQFAARVLLDGEPVEAIPEATTRESAEACMRAHSRERTANPGWRGSAELVRRKQHTTPWELVDSPSVNSATAAGCTSRQAWICTPQDCPGCFNPHCWVIDANTCRNGCNVKPRNSQKTTTEEKP